MSRPRLHQDAAARQRAYRQRKQAQPVIPDAQARPNRVPAVPEPVVVRVPLQVVDDSGRLVAEIGVDDEGPYLVLLDAKGVTLAELGADWKGGSLRLYHPGGNHYREVRS